MEGWNTVKAAQAQGIQQLGCIKCRRVFEPEEFVSMNGRQFCKMCSACRKIHRDADRVYKRQRREREYHENMLALATKYEKFFRGTQSLGTSDTGSPPLNSYGSSSFNPVNGMATIEASTNLEIDLDASIKYEVPEVEDTFINSQDSKMEPEIIPYQFCLSCGIPRNSNLVYSEICVYCMEEKKYCIYGDHEEDRPDFVDKHGDEHVRCNNCRGHELTDFIESSHDTKLKRDDDQSRAVESQMEVDLQADNKPELHVQAELGIGSQVDFDLHVDTGSQTDIKPLLGIKSQLDDQSLLDDDLPQDDEPQPGTEVGTQIEFNFCAYETGLIENEPAIQISNVKPESMASIDMNSIPRFQSSSIQGMGNLFDPIIIDSD